MILVDTSVWVDYFNGQNNEHTNALDRALDEGLVLLGDVILLEVLQGFRSEVDFNTAKKSLETLDQVKLFGGNMVYMCANNYRNLWANGITIRRTTYLVIATYCMEHKVPLLFQDTDFKPFVENMTLVPALEEI